MVFSLMSAYTPSVDRKQPSQLASVPRTVTREDTYHTPGPQRGRRRPEAVEPVARLGEGGDKLSHKDKRRLHNSLTEVFSGLALKENTYRFTPFQRGDVQSDFFMKYDKLRRAMGHSGDWTLGEGGSLRCVSGHPLTARELLNFSTMAASLLVSKAVVGKLQDDLITLTQNPTHRHSQGYTLASILEYVQRQTEGYHPIMSLLKTMGDDLRLTTYSSPDEVYQWGQAVLERGAWVALSLGRSLKTHEAAIVHASLTEYRPLTEAATQAPSEEDVFQRKLDAWLDENPERRKFPRTSDEAAILGYPRREGKSDEDYEAAIVEAEQAMEKLFEAQPKEAFQRLRELRVAHKLYTQASNKFREEAREEIEQWKEAQRPTGKRPDHLGSDDQLSRSQRADACRHFGGLGLLRWLHQVNDRVVEPVRLSPLGWRKVFFACTPRRYRGMYEMFDDHVLSPNAWIREVEAAVDAWLRGVGQNRLSDERKKVKKKEKRVGMTSGGTKNQTGGKLALSKVGEKVKTGWKTPKDTLNPTASAAGAEESRYPADKGIGCPRHYLEPQEFGLFIAQPTPVQRIGFLRENLEKSTNPRITSQVKTTYRNIYKKRLAELEREEKQREEKKPIAKSTGSATPVSSRTRGRKRQQQFGKQTETAEVSQVEAHNCTDGKNDGYHHEEYPHSGADDFPDSVSEYEYEDLYSGDGGTEEDSYTDE
jgi:hypothetical protein